MEFTIKIPIFKPFKSAFFNLINTTMKENPPHHSQERGLLEDFIPKFTRASTSKRFANYIIDRICFYIFLYLFGYALLSIDYNLSIIIEKNSFFGLLMLSIFYGLYMGLIELIFKGRSFGKFITGTIAVNHDGSRISEKTAVLRGLTRLVPFNAFSALSDGYPWHDHWNKTYVVDYVKSDQT